MTTPTPEERAAALFRRETGIVYIVSPVTGEFIATRPHEHEVAAAIREAVAAEREACAELAESLEQPPVQGKVQRVRSEVCQDIAAAIRARGPA